VICRSLDFNCRRLFIYTRKRAQGNHVHGNLVTSLPLMTTQGSHAFLLLRWPHSLVPILLLTTHCSIIHLSFVISPFLVILLVHCSSLLFRFHQRSYLFLRSINSSRKADASAGGCCVLRGACGLLLGGDARGIQLKLHQAGCPGYGLVVAGDRRMNECTYSAWVLCRVAPP